jgi:hypothetical protein
LCPEPPVVLEWLHEVKFDRWQGQLHFGAGAASVDGRSAERGIEE